MERAFQRMYLESRSRSHHGHGGDGVAFGARLSGRGRGGMVPRAGDGGGDSGGEAQGGGSTVASMEDL